MATSADRYSILYKPSLSIMTKGVDGKTLSISPSDIVTIAFIHNYDKAMFPIIRIRLYSDLSVIEELTQYPDQIYVSLSLIGNVYRMADDDNKSPTMMTGVKNLNFSLKGYIENKNTPTSKMDQYEHGIKKKSDLNIDRKVPIELYCYDAELIHYMQKKAPGIFKGMSLTTIIETMFRKQGIVNYTIQSTKNQEKYDQVLIPNLNITSTLSFFDDNYGLYPKGAIVYGDIDKLYICDSAVDNGTKPLPIYVESFKNPSDMGGVRRIDTKTYQMNTMAVNVSVISETDIERVLNSENINAVNVNTLSTHTTSFENLFPDIKKDKVSRIRLFVESLNKGIHMDLNHTNIIDTTDILHKSKNNYVSDMYIARISERITRVDLSGVGFDIGQMNVMTRYNLIFDSPIRGIHMNQLYRPSMVNHVLTNLDSGLFVAQTTMSLCSN